MAPKQPTHIKNVKELQAALEDLQYIQTLVQNAPPSSFDAVGASIKENLYQPRSDNGIVEAPGLDGLDKRYHDNATTITAHAWPAVTSGIGALVGMLTTTLATHTSTDANVQSGAHNTNTTMQSAGSEG